MTTPKVINIVSAIQLAGYQLSVQFDDGKTQIVDFRTFLSQSRHPEIRAFLDPQRFTTFRIENGELVWGDYELSFPVIDLYNNRILHTDQQAVAA